MSRWDLSAQQKAADFTARVLDGGAFSTVAVAEMYGMTRMGAYFMIEKIGAVIPLIKDEETGEYKLMPKQQ